MDAFLLAAIVVAIVAAILDWRTGHIPHKLTITVLVAATLIRTALALRRPDLEVQEALMEGAYSLVGAFFCALVPLFLHRQNALGGGDVMLFAVLGALLHPMLGVEAEMYSFFAAAILAPAKLAYDCFRRSETHRR
jgi:prepilin peptidase CpaA